MSGLLPAGRKLQLGTYWTTLWAGLPSPGTIPNTDYDFRLMSTGLGTPSLSGVTAYDVQLINPGAPMCNDFNFLNTGFCTLWKAYSSSGTCTPGQIEACGLCGTHTCSANFIWGACTSQGACTPGATRTTNCGTRCGTEIDTCSNTCQWSIGTCGNQGVCTPGATMACCPCGGAGCGCTGEALCGSTCGWGSCQGYQCKPHVCQ